MVRAQCTVVASSSSSQHIPHLACFQFLTEVKKIHRERRIESSTPEIGGETKVSNGMAKGKVVNSADFDWHFKVRDRRKMALGKRFQFTYVTQRTELVLVLLITYIEIFYGKKLEARNVLFAWIWILMSKYVEIRRDLQRQYLQEIILCIVLRWGC